MAQMVPPSLFCRYYIYLSTGTSTASSIHPAMLRTQFPMAIFLIRKQERPFSISRQKRLRKFFQNCGPHGNANLGLWMRIQIFYAEFNHIIANKKERLEAIRCVYSDGDGNRMRETCSGHSKCRLYWNLRQ